MSEDAVHRLRREWEGAVVEKRVVELELSAMDHRGQALGRYQGKVVFVPGAIPGEVVRARVVEERKRWSRAELLSVLEISPHRVEPPCPYFGQCGGCQWQHIAYEAQLDYKRQMVVEQLERVGHLQDPVVRPTIGMSNPWFYRNHVQLAQSDAGQLGFRAAQSHDVVPIDQCLVLHPLLDELHAALDLDWPSMRRLSLRAGIETGEQMCIFETADDKAPDLEVGLAVSCILRLSDGTDVTLVGSNVYHETLRGRQFRISASSFFQVNTVQAEVLLGVVQEYLDPQADDVLLDLYCGVGTLGLSMQDWVEHVIGIEENPSAIADARVNASDACRVTLFEEEAENLLPRLKEAVTKVVLDPPRQGCKPGVIRSLLHLAPRRIVYVSCDPATFARDAALLAEGGYSLVEAQPVDMFPQTYHIETASLWCHLG